jgi:hypothetical protein
MQSPRSFSSRTLRHPLFLIPIIETALKLKFDTSCLERLVPLYLPPPPSPIPSTIISNRFLRPSAIEFRLRMSEKRYVDSSRQSRSQDGEDPEDPVILVMSAHDRSPKRSGRVDTAVINRDGDEMSGRDGHPNDQWSDHRNMLLRFTPIGISCRHDDEH